MIHAYKQKLYKQKKHLLERKYSFKSKLIVPIFLRICNSQYANILGGLRKPCKQRHYYSKNQHNLD